MQHKKIIKKLIEKLVEEETTKIREDVESSSPPQLAGRAVRVLKEDYHIRLFYDSCVDYFKKQSCADAEERARELVLFTANGFDRERRERWESALENYKSR